MALSAQTLDSLTHFTPCPVATITAVGDQTGIDISALEGDIQFILTATAAGSGAAFASRIEESDTLGGTYTAVTGGAFTEIGNAVSKQVLTLNADNLKSFIRYSVTAETGTASSVISVNAYGVNKYQS